MFNLDEYENNKEKANLHYKTIGHVFSPVLNEKIYFNSEGFNHIIYKNKREERDKASQTLRFKLIPIATDLIELSTTYQEYEETMQDVLVERYGKFSRENKIVKYWGIIAILSNRKVKVVLKKIGNGQTIYWSVIPAWKTSNHRDIKLFHTMEGNPETD